MAALIVVLFSSILKSDCGKQRAAEKLNKIKR